jgi:formylmethanofuran dehydrogenase subunit E
MADGAVIAPPAIDVADAPHCPHCGEYVLIERDPLGGGFVCCVCARTWIEAAQ